MRGEALISRINRANFDRRQRAEGQTDLDWKSKYWGVGLCSLLSHKINAVPFLYVYVLITCTLRESWVGTRIFCFSYGALNMCFLSSTRKMKDGRSTDKAPDKFPLSGVWVESALVSVLWGNPRPSGSRP